MKHIFKPLIILFMALEAASCGTIKDKDALVLIETELGDIKVMLYDETPLHKENFLKLVREGFYDGQAFHRVIKNFVVQGGDPDSKGAPAGKQLGTGGPGYNVDAEIVYPQLFHKRGALAAARQGDETNPERKSSGSQFYIVWGETYSEGKLNAMEDQMTQMQERKIFDKLAAERRSEIMDLRRNKDQDGLYNLQEELIAMTKAMMSETPKFKFTPQQREAYKVKGGTPHLDNEYTVFGEVIEGLEVVEKIQKCKTQRGDRPEKDITYKMKLIKK
ncbi:MAG: peptidylprolyl isomerase [Bacteroidales bacterium]